MAEVGEPATEHIACGGAVFVFTAMEEAWDCWRACDAKIREPDASDGGTKTRGGRGREEGAWVGTVGQRPAITCVVRLSFCFLLPAIGSLDATRRHSGSPRPYSCLLHRPASSPQHQGYSHRKDFIFLRFTSFIDMICHLFFNLLWQETSSAQYILQQNIATSGGFKLLSSIRNTYSMGKVRMVATEFETATRITKNRNPTRDAESGGFVLWCISQLPLGRLRKFILIVNLSFWMKSHLGAISPKFKKKQARSSQKLTTKLHSSLEDPNTNDLEDDLPVDNASKQLVLHNETSSTH
ncbi:hypothetical protein ZIOFF_022492 [Zingiber officinale]|uniref:Uncharacterized protein n=1 Tax=Zingiber officinale TaxID=94328 RepID=A0A8J5LK63_ZINOF|nr:hypothetical protein ZIOFF_022492 [Zingiber officinale]